MGLHFFHPYSVQNYKRDLYENKNISVQKPVNKVTTIGKITQSNKNFLTSLGFKVL